MVSYTLTGGESAEGRGAMDIYAVSSRGSNRPSVSVWLIRRHPLAWLHERWAPIPRTMLILILC